MKQKAWPDPAKLPRSTDGRNAVTHDELMLIMNDTKMTEQELAAKLGVSTMSTWRWINDRASMSIYYSAMIRELAEGTLNFKFMDANKAERVVRDIEAAGILNQTCIDNLLDLARSYQIAHHRLLRLGALWEQTGAEFSDTGVEG